MEQAHCYIVVLQGVNKILEFKNKHKKTSLKWVRLQRGNGVVVRPYGMYDPSLYFLRVESSPNQNLHEQNDLILLPFAIYQEHNKDNKDSCSSKQELISGLNMGGPESIVWTAISISSEEIEKNYSGHNRVFDWVKNKRKWYGQRGGDREESGYLWRGNSTVKWCQGCLESIERKLPIASDRRKISQFSRWIRQFTK